MNTLADPLYNQIRISRDSEKVMKLLDQEGVDLSALLSESVEKLNPIAPEMKGQLEQMREDLGDELFDKIAAGDSLMQSLDRWAMERFNMNQRILMAIVRERLGGRASQVEDREIVNFLHLVVAAATRVEEGEPSAAQ